MNYNQLWWVWVPAFAGTTAEFDVAPERTSEAATKRSRLQDEPTQIRVLGEVADVLLHIGGVDAHGLA
ncbi:hypothetical protein SSBR45G_24980 [Bradyrhizobium sp. SSBR45G]|nr:hypothetical protein SSBR45G_24980 [Bradyrhizobium sp. SSBR45G]GLH84827.1 hypothetical protein SSBR45R_22870 [Bradyrhizobium sp. SSBR45R]